MRVYLAGGITGLTYSEAVDWREQFTKDLFDIGHIGVSPMRGKDYLRGMFAEDEAMEKSQITGYYQKNGTAIDAEAALQKTYEQFPMSGEQGIFGRDTFDVRHCEVILANLYGATKVSIGTVMEIQRGYDLDRYVIVVMEEGGIHEHPFVRRAASIVVPNLNEAFHVIAAMGAPYRS